MTVRDAERVFPFASRAVIVTTLLPAVSGMLAVHVVVPLAVPLPPALFVQRVAALRANPPPAGFFCSLLKAPAVGHRRRAGNP